MVGTVCPVFEISGIRYVTSANRFSNVLLIALLPCFEVLLAPGSVSTNLQNITTLLQTHFVFCNAGNPLEDIGCKISSIEG